MPISELSKLLRQECRFDLCDTLPHAAITTPCCTIIAEVEPISSTYSCTRSSFFADHPPCSGLASCFHSVLGMFRDWGRAATARPNPTDRKSTRLNSSHLGISYAVFC